MLRRSHKKSRAGCSECKRRHIKCDEGRPVCRLCALSSRNCSYALQAQPTNLSTPTTYVERSISPGDNHSEETVTLSDVPLNDLILSNSNSLGGSNINDRGNPIFDEAAVNLNHAELLIHLTLDEEITNLGHDSGIDDYPSRISTALKIGLECPYLLHELLAFSACRLAFLHPERSTFYHHQAVALQTRAVSLFNTTRIAVDRSNCVAILLFATILGHHLLADALAKREPRGLDAFMSHYTQSLNTARGVNTIAKAAWPLLMETELGPILSLSKRFTSSIPIGNDCQQISKLVEGAHGLSEEEKEACRLAIQYLQLGFDAMLAEEEQGFRYQMIFLWTMLVPPKFTSLLAAKQPEALVVLGYYALLLHYGRNMWQVLDSGAYILRIVVDYLDPEWQHWLEHPLNKIVMDLQ